MIITSKKGYVLALAIVFVIIVAIIGFALYASIERSVMEIRAQETEYTKGYYKTLATLRIGALLLKDPEPVFSGGLSGDQSVVKFDLWRSVSTYPDHPAGSFPVEMGLTYEGELVLELTKRGDGYYKVKATYQLPEFKLPPP